MLFKADVDWTFLLKLYFQVDVSQEFLHCMDRQLTAAFVAATGIPVKERIPWLSFSQDLSSVWINEKGIIMAYLAISAHGGMNVRIQTNIHSDQDERLGDPKVACEALQFEWIDLDPDLCREFMKPTWTLSPRINRDMLRFGLFRDFGLKVGNAFLAIADRQLTAQFIAATGLKINRNIYMSTGYALEGVTAGVPRLELPFRVDVQDNYYYLKMVCESVDGAPIDPLDEAIDEQKLRFRFEGLDPVQIKTDLVLKRSGLPNMPALSYVLYIQSLAGTVIMEIIGKTPDSVPVGQMVEGLTRMIEAQQEADEGKVHQWYTVEREDGLDIHMDLGTSSQAFLRNLLIWFDSLGGIAMVRIG